MVTARLISSILHAYVDDLLLERKDLSIVQSKFPVAVLIWFVYIALVAHGDVLASTCLSHQYCITEEMASQKHVFKVSGPIHLTSVNWNCPHHQRSVIASLVQGVYVLERDRQLNRLGSEACAPPWWETFNFEVTWKLIDDADGSIFGAIYAFKPPPNLHCSTVATPRFVIAFRGTLTKKATVCRDLKLDLQIGINKLHQSSRFTIAMKAVRSLVAAFGHQAVWLAGHSQGASVATLAGKNMAMEGKHLNTFLFNPPVFSAPIERIKDTKVKDGLLITKSIMTAGLSLTVKGSRQESDSFTVLSSWLPSLFVNKSDDICSSYIGHFGRRNMMEQIGFGSVEKLAAKNSLKDLVLNGAFGVESESLYLLPSANLTVNRSPSSKIKKAHGISQWWRSDLDLQSEVYRYE